MMCVRVQCTRNNHGSWLYNWTWSRNEKKVSAYIHAHEHNYTRRLRIDLEATNTRRGRRSRSFVVVHFHSAGTAAPPLFVNWFRFSRPPLILWCKTCLCACVYEPYIIYHDCKPTAENEKKNKKNKRYGSDLLRNTFCIALCENNSNCNWCVGHRHRIDDGLYKIQYVFDIQYYVGTRSPHGRNNNSIITCNLSCFFIFLLVYRHHRNGICSLYTVDVPSGSV